MYAGWIKILCKPELSNETKYLSPYGPKNWGWSRHQPGGVMYVKKMGVFFIIFKCEQFDRKKTLFSQTLGTSWNGWSCTTGMNSSSTVKSNGSSRVGNGMGIRVIVKGMSVVSVITVGFGFSWPLAVVMVGSGITISEMSIAKKYTKFKELIKKF